MYLLPMSEINLCHVFDTFLFRMLDSTRKVKILHQKVELQTQSRFIHLPIIIFQKILKFVLEIILFVIMLIQMFREIRKKSHKYIMNKIYMNIDHYLIQDIIARQ